MKFVRTTPKPTSQVPGESLEDSVRNEPRRTEAAAIHQIYEDQEGMERYSAGLGWPKNMKRTNEVLAERYVDQSLLYDPKQKASSRLVPSEVAQEIQRLLDEDDKEGAKRVGEEYLRTRRV